MVSAENSSYYYIWLIDVGVQSVGRRIETEVELDS